MRGGDRVTDRAGLRFGTVEFTDDYRASVAWDGGGSSIPHVSELRVIPPVSVAAVVATEAVSVRMETLVDEVTDVIASLVRTVCMGERDLYRDLLERVAQRLGDV